MSCIQLVPGLPDDIARECLIRVPHDQFSTAGSVCRGWKVEIESPEFFRRRKAAGYSQNFVAMAQARVNPNPKPGGAKFPTTPVYRVTICEPETGSWSELPPVPCFSYGLPIFCQFAGVGSDLVVIGGWDPVTWEVLKSVFIYNFVSATWRCGTDMPGCPRSFFRCASDFNRTVFVAGGHDDEKNALRSALAYDVSKDEWVKLPDMAKERDECKAIFHRGKFNVIGGYHTEKQGQFESSGEAFDTATWRWDRVEEGFLDANTCPRTCVDGGDGKLYMCSKGYVVARESDTWRSVVELPADVCSTAHVTAWQGKLLVIGSRSFGEPHMAYVLDLKGYTWTKVDVPEEFSGHVQSGCCLQI